MSTLQRLLDKNQAWAAARLAEDPGFFKALAKQQRPEYLWIGCSDSRMPAEQITGLQPGELFVHRNIANLIQPGDLNCLAVIQFAVAALKVRQVIVCGHYGCGGVQAALEDSADGIVDYWLWNIKLTIKKHQGLLAGVAEERRADLICELNVIEQLMALSQHHAIQDGWARGAALTLHGCIYDISKGRLRDLDIDCGRDAPPVEVYAVALEKLASAYR